MMVKYGLIGLKLSHSFSAQYFNQKFEQEKVKAHYINFPLATISDFSALIENEKDLRGLNVTIPYKEAVLSFLDEIDVLAQKAGAVNCIKIVYKKGNDKPILIGYNTDIIGFKTTLEPLLPSHLVKALILGTGGASKAVKVALEELSIPYTFVSRNKKEQGITYEEVTKEILQSHQLIINTTPLGMYPNVSQKPILPYEALTSEHICYDLIYNPSSTSFLMEARERGCKVINGLPMLYKQADESYKIWTQCSD